MRKSGYYAQFMQSTSVRYDEKTCKLLHVDPYDIDMLASEGYVWLDGRKCLENMITEAENKARRMRFVHHITAFKIMNGDLLNGVCLYQQKFDNGFMEARNERRVNK